MEQTEVENIQKEISTKIRLPKEEKNKIYKKMFINLLIALAVLIYFIFLNLGYLRLDTEVFKADLKMFAIILLGFTIYFIEKAYKTDRGTYIIHAVELFVLSVITLYMPYVYFYHNEIAQFLFTTSAVYLAIYYTIKCICMYVIYKNRYIRKESDVKDIIKEEKASYLDEKSSKKFEEETDTPSDKKTSKKKNNSKKDKGKAANVEAEINNKSVTKKKKTQAKENEVKTKKTSKVAKDKKEEKTKSTSKENVETKTTTKKNTKTDQKTNEDKPKAKRTRKPKTANEDKEENKEVATKKKNDDSVEEKPKTRRGRKPKASTEDKAKNTEKTKKAAKTKTTKKSTNKKEKANNEK